jgi:serine phosphatase RsbU (regulator of sigma subunit)
LVALLIIQNSALSQTQTPLPEVVSLYQKASASKDYIQAAQFAYEIAMRYDDTDDKNKVIEYLNQAATNAKKSGDQALLHVVVHQLGMQHSDSKKYTKALENFQSALGAARKLQNNELIKEDLINVSISYGYLDRLKKSIEHAEEALSMAIKDQDVSLQQKCYQLLAEFHKRDVNVKKSEEYLTQYNALITAQQREALKAKQIQELEEHVQSAGLETQVAQAKLSEQNEKLLHTNASLRMMEHSLRRTKDNLNATADSLKEIEAISRNRQMEIDLLQKDKELAGVKIKEQETRLENEALIRNFIAVASLLSIALVTVLVISNRKKIKANKKIAEQNKNIRSSINYAKRIQEAMLPKTEHYPSVFKDSFILFKPRDTVSGDFYWISETKNGTDTDVAFAAVDCTGHGVPGAFMSMIGMKALNGLVNRGMAETHLMLDALDTEIRTALRQEVSGNNDGMDIALCIYREKQKMLEFSGAKIPLVYIQNHELFKIKSDTHSIGGRKKNNDTFSFKKHQIAIDKPTVLYLFSDGYKDQFGGPANTKFLSKKLHKLLLQIHELPMEEQMNLLEKAITEWKGTREQTDDILVMGIKISPVGE